MIANSKKQISDSFLLGAILALAGGFLDAYTYLCRGGVFANAETGNIVLMGIKLANGSFLQAAYFLVPILCFSAGVLVAQIIRSKFRKNTLVHWRQITVAFEIAVLFAIAFVPSDEKSNMITNALVSFVCSLQVQSFRQINGNSIATTMCTGNLRSATEKLYEYITNKEKGSLISALHYFGIIILFIIGASAGAVITNIFSVKAVLLPCALLLICFMLMFINNKNKKK